MEEINIFWNRSDHRLNDNPALYYCVEDALRQNKKVLNLFILDPHFTSKSIYSRRLKYMYQILKKLEKGMNLNIIQDDYIKVFTQLSKKFKITIFLNADYEPYGRQRDNDLLQLAKNIGFEVKMFADKITVDLDTISGTGTIYSVFTPFKNKVIESFLNSKTLPKVNLDNISTIREFPNVNFELLIINLKPLSIDIGGQIFELEDLNKQLEFNWYSCEEEAIDVLEKFIKNKYFEYDKIRDELTNTNSMMSVALKWGLVSSRFIKDKILEVDKEPIKSVYISELIWREFYKYLLYHYPKLLNEEFQSKYRNVQTLWVDPKEQAFRFQKWINSQTGYQVVDASMKQIVKEGFMHNRARMIVGSILTKNLGVDWRYGQEYFRAMLLDLDEASNNGGWQWSASVGADPKPIRIFNPYIQTEKFDPKNVFINKYLLDSKLPIIVEHPIARDEAILRYKSIQKK
jgi:deoxyribodipyrimidine photo-lyase